MRTVQGSSRVKSPERRVRVWRCAYV